MRITLVRHATLLLDTTVGRILVDPMLRAQGTSPPIENAPNPQRNPLVDLPFPVDEVLAGVDLCIVTHLHRDHFDDLIPLDLPILTQPESADELRSRGHTDVTARHDAIPMTRGRHGTGAVGAELGPVSAGSWTASTSPATRSSATRSAMRSTGTARAQSSRTPAAPGSTRAGRSS